MKKLTLDIVSDVVCPWCAVGFGNLQTALEQLADDVEVDIHWRAFELNPYMGSDGQEINEHLMEKYGIDEQQLAQNKQHLITMGKQAGVEFNFVDRSRIFNTLDCHKLLHWAAQLDDGPNKEKQTRLKLALFDAYFRDGLNISDQNILLSIVEKIGLDREAALRVLSDESAKTQVREEQSVYRNLGINSVPAVIVNQQYLISGGQPAETFKQALSEIAAKS